MNIPPKDKYGNPKNINPFKKERLKRFPKTQKLFNKFYSQRSIEDKIRGVNPEYYSLFLSPIELQNVQEL
jgi:hypothetical protein